MTFSDVCASLLAKGDLWQVHIPADWRQGRAVFGGLQAALAVEAMRRTQPEPVPLRSFQMTFLAPLQGEYLQIDVKLLRQGKHVQHVEARLLEDGYVLATTMAVFGHGRDSAVTVHPVWQSVDDSGAFDAPHIKDVTPEFLRHFHGRWLKGTLPISGQLSTAATVIAGLHGERSSHERHVFAFGDYMPPLALSGLSSRAPGSSMTWMLEVLRDDVDGHPLSGWRIDAELQAAAGGYTSQSCVIWTPDQRALALGRQTMAVFG